MRKPDNTRDIKEYYDEIKRVLDEKFKLQSVKSTATNITTLAGDKTITEALIKTDEKSEAISLKGGKKIQLIQNSAQDGYMD
jgi:hypothetical protein